MAALADRTLGQLLDDVAERTPAPGGGSCSATVCALGAGLVEMAAAVAIARDADDARAAQIHARAAQLRADSLALAEEELSVYAAVLEAMRLPKDTPGRAERVDAAMSDATDSPLAIARAAGEIAALAAEIAVMGNLHLRGDALAGGLLADGACRAALQLVALNLSDSPDDPRHEEARELAQRPWMTALSDAGDV